MEYILLFIIVTTLPTPKLSISKTSKTNPRLTAPPQDCSRSDAVLGTCRSCPVPGKHFLYSCVDWQWPPFCLVQHPLWNRWLCSDISGLALDSLYIYLLLELSRIIYSVWVKATLHIYPSYPSSSRLDIYPAQFQIRNATKNMKKLLTFLQWNFQMLTPLLCS